MIGSPGSEPAYPAAWEADVLLRDGTPVHVRPITPADGDDLRRFHHGLSERTVYYRFFGAKPELTDRDVEYFTHVDHRDRVALIALDVDGIAGVGRFDLIGDGSAEVAFVVRDAAQGLGLGSVLLEHLAAAARERGVRRFVAEVLPQNRRMVATFSEAGFDVDAHLDQDVLAVSFPVDETATSRAVMDAREHRAESRSVARLLEPRCVAVVGASRQQRGLGHAVLTHLRLGGFRGELVAVHREADQIDGVRCVRSLHDVGAPVDLAVVVVPAAEVPEVVRQAAEARVHGLVVVSGGFADGDPGGADLQAALVESVHLSGMRLVGPNALGVINTDPDVRLNASLVPRLPERGSVGFFCQSGALGGAIIDRLAAAGLGLSTFVSAGNRADISGNDLLQYWEDDDATSLVLLYLETIGNARKFARIVHRLSARKPVLMVRAGGAGARHPLGHEVGSTLLDQRAVDRVLADCGLILVDTVDQLIGVARVAAAQPLPTGSTVAVVGNSDALATMAVNACGRAGLSVAGEPTTFARDRPASAYVDAVAAALDDPSTGAVLAIHVAPVEHPGGGEVLAALEAFMPGGARHRGVPVVLVAAGEPTSAGEHAVLPRYRDVEDAVHPLGVLARHADWHRGQAAAGLEPPPDVTDLADVDLTPGTRTGHDAADWLAAAGVPVAAAPTVPATQADPGLRARLFDDPLFGPVLTVSVDDPVAERLGDRSVRLAPVSLAGARAMLAELQALPPTDDGAARERAAAVVTAVSAVAVRHPQVTDVDLRGLHEAADPSARMWVAAASVTVASTPVALEPPARRL